MKTLISLAALALSLSGTAAFAGDDAAPSGGGGKGSDARYQKTTTINFEDDTIEGDLTKPDGEYVEARKQVKHEKLIKIREEFKDKVMESVSEL